MKKFLTSFRDGEAGAVTVDWVVLTAGIVGLGVAAFGSMQDETTNLADNIGSYMASQ